MAQNTRTTPVEQGVNRANTQARARNKLSPLFSEANRCAQQVLERLVTDGAEVGLQVAAYLHGELVVDTWAGLADVESGRPVDGETLFTSWSTTKGWVATCLHILADRGVIDYDAPVAAYWPEFASHGKATITVRHVLAHTAGLPQMPELVTPAMITNWETMVAALANMTPLWTPGTQTGYHAWTYGWLAGEIVRRADGRPLAQFAREELCAPLEIQDFYLGIPDGVAERVATLRDEVVEPADDTVVDALHLAVMPPAITCAESVNLPAVRRASIPGAGGIMTARAIARHYAMLAGYGELDGIRLLSSQRIDMMRALQTDAFDPVVGKRLRKGLGYQLGGAEDAGGFAAMGATGREFGHTGLGGSIGFADPERGLAFGLTKTLLKAPVEAPTSAKFQVAEAVRAVVDRAAG